MSNLFILKLQGMFIGAATYAYLLNLFGVVGIYTVFPPLIISVILLSPLFKKGGDE